MAHFEPPEDEPQPTGMTCRKVIDAGPHARAVVPWLLAFLAISPLRRRLTPAQILDDLLKTAH